MREFVQNHCEFCVICRRSKTSRDVSYKILSSLFLFQYKWFDITMIFVTSLFNNKNWIEITYNSILIVLNWFTKMTHYIFVIKKINAKQLINIIIKKIVKYHDISKFIMIDRDFLFISNFFFRFVMFWNWSANYLLHFIFKWTIKWNVKTILWNNIYEFMSILFKIIEFYFCL